MNHSFQPPVLSVITVCRNAEKTILSTLRSVASQKTSQIEYIVIDGMSSDDTVDIVRSFDGLADVLVSEPDNGLYDAMNKGAAIARGSYVCYLNADDSYMTGSLALIVSAASDNPEADVLYGDWIGLSQGGVAIKRQASRQLGWRYKLCHQAMAVRRNLLGIHPFDLRFGICADFDAILRWTAAPSNWVHISAPLVMFSEEGLSNTRVTLAARESVSIAYAQLGFLKSWRFCILTILHAFKCILISRGRIVQRLLDTTTMRRL